MSNETIPDSNESEKAPLPFPEVTQTKQWRKDLDEILQRIKRGSDKTYPGEVDVFRSSRERSLAITKVEEAIMWLGMDLKL